MNSLANLGATIALFWLSLEFFETIANEVLGFAVLCFALVFLVNLWEAGAADMSKFGEMFSRDQDD